MTSEMGDRPQPNTFVQVDSYNAYARLGVSPLATDKEIKQAYNNLDSELRARLRDKTSQEFSDVENQITELQKIEELIGSPKSRSLYDEAHPYNELLTVQSLPTDAFDDPVYRASLVSSWLLEQLGSDAILHNPNCTWLWEGDNSQFPSMNAGHVTQIATDVDAESPTAEDEMETPDLAQLDS